MTSSRASANRATPSEPILYRPSEVAKQLGCSEWWIKEQARHRRIPFSWIGGRYSFTDEHVAAIIAIFEKRPAGQVVPANEMQVQEVSNRRGTAAAHVKLKARSPKRGSAARARQNAA
ncbi:hypothetical protein [Crossiella sp. CA198]|uniref:hypothetical protein n=1 Tax=Crossiella sp. CA198 TaxID=3455607 RepID=UPI003F8D0F76